MINKTHLIHQTKKILLRNFLITIIVICKLDHFLKNFFFKWKIKSQCEFFKFFLCNSFIIILQILNEFIRTKKLFFHKLWSELIKLRKNLPLNLETHKILLYLNHLHQIPQKFILFEFYSFSCPLF